MRGCVRVSDAIGGAAAILVVATLPAFADPAPRRVVSMNLCLDQIAMRLAAPGQLLSVSALTADPDMSPLADRTGPYRLNHGRAEEIYLMRPDLVIAGSWISPATLSLMRDLGIRVEVLPPADSLQAIGEQIDQIGALLGREDQAQWLRRDFESRLADLRHPADRGEAAIYYANGYTSGGKTLAGSILRAAGYDNIASEYGIDDTRVLPLEKLVLADPDRVVSGSHTPGRSQGEAIMAHPALIAVAPEARAETDRDWVCGTPDVLGAIAGLE